jgi:hypothetical protein
LRNGPEFFRKSSALFFRYDHRFAMTSLQVLMRGAGSGTPAQDSDMVERPVIVARDDKLGFRESGLQSLKGRFPVIAGVAAPAILYPDFH